MPHCKDILTLPDQRPIYLIMDALDESPNTSGIPSARERALHFLKSWSTLAFRIFTCFASRPEIDTRSVIEPLISLQVTFHDQTGQKEEYCRLCQVYHLLEFGANHKEMEGKTKDFVTNALAERGDGMYLNLFTFVIFF